MKYRTEQEEFWAGEFGLNYTKRSNTETYLASKVALWEKILRVTSNVNSARELGCNLGINLLALKQLKPKIQLSGYEINVEAVKQAIDFNIAKITQGSILEKINDEKVDLTFTSGVLIHINPDYLSNVYDNLVNGSNRYIVVSEYYNSVPTKIAYRGVEDRLFKRDFAGDLIENYRLKLVDYGFVYKRDIRAPQDDVTWFLLEK